MLTNKDKYYIVDTRTNEVVTRCKTRLPSQPSQPTDNDDHRTLHSLLAKMQFKAEPTGFTDNEVKDWVDKLNKLTSTTKTPTTEEETPPEFKINNKHSHIEVWELLCNSYPSYPLCPYLSTWTVTPPVIPN